MSPVNPTFSSSPGQAVHVWIRPYPAVCRILLLTVLLTVYGFTADRQGEISGTVVNVRGGASAKSAKVVQLRRGDPLTIIGEQGNWYHVKLGNGLEGYIVKKYVKITGMAPEPIQEMPELGKPVPESEQGSIPRATESILETEAYKKSTEWWVKSSTQMVVFEKETGFNPLDSAENYRLVRDQYQSFSLLLNRRNDNRRQGIAAGTEIWSEDSTAYKLHSRLSSLHYFLKNHWGFHQVTLGRQNVYTGFHYYKLDGAGASVKLGKSFSLEGFAGLRVDTSWSFDNSGNPSGYLQLTRKFGYRSSIFIGFERANLYDKINANDLGIGANLKLGKHWDIKTKSRASWDKKAELTETKNRLQYRLNKNHIFYGGYNYFNPVFRDTLQAYFFDLFDYNKAYMGWRFRPWKKKNIYFSSEGSLMQIHELLIFHGKIMLTTRYFNFMAIQRLGDLDGAAVVSAQFNYPLHYRFAVGSGVDYANMDLYYQGPENFYSYYGMFRYQPFNPASLLIKIENRQSLFAERDIRIVGNLTLSYSNRKGRYFVWEDN